MSHKERAAGTPVHVTGIGLITPLGNTLQAFDTAVFAGRSALRKETIQLQGITPFDVSIGACDFDSTGIRSVSRLPLDRGTALALAAAEDAISHAKLSNGSTLDADPLRVGVFWGSGIAGVASVDASLEELYLQHRRLRPTTVLTVMPNAAVGELALRWHAQASAIGYACACASSAIAIGEAIRGIRGGWIDVAIVGGHESHLSPALISGWHAMRVLAPPPPDAPETACRPFSADRTGFALSEGAGALVLESAAHARARGATTHGLLTGYATNCDGAHITNPDPESQARVMRAALRDAGLSSEDIGYINAHGTATATGDAAEAQSIHAVFGDQAPVSSTKAIHGHLLGAGGVVELITTLRALAKEELPPTAHLHTPDPAFTIDLVRGTARPARNMRYAMSNAFAFGGTNAVLIAEKV